MGDALPPGHLVLCATPLGNLGDVSERMRTTLAGASVIACEDTRVTRRLLSALDIPAPELVTYTEERHERVGSELVRRLVDGETVVLVSDAGLPAISDPGARLVRACHEAGVPVTGVPGPSAPALAAALAGDVAGRYRFVGFLPRKGHDLERLLRDDGGCATVAFESPQRLQESLRRIAAVAPERGLVICRELTKLHEEVVAGGAAELARDWADREVKGEVTLVLAPSDRTSRSEAAPDVAVRLARAAANAGLGARSACKVVAGELGLRPRDLYEALLD